jgi:hypothetical protein
VTSTSELSSLPSATDDGSTTADPFVLDRRPRWALYAFIALEVVALALYVHAGSKRWFFHDEWTFLINKDGGDIESLLRPSNEHWTTLPVISYRILFNLFGINSYLPYQLVTIVCHLTAAALLRVIMRRAQVSAWMATLVAGVFLFFGSGDHNILRAFQVTFGAALVFGLVQLVLADHDGRIDRRDWLGLLSGVAALMCSGVGISMVAAVGAAAFIRRGWRKALFHIAPLAVIYVVWWLVYARDETRSDGAGGADVLRFVVSVTANTFDAIGQSTVVAALLGALLIGGFAVLVSSKIRPTDLRRRTAASVGLLFGMVTFVGITSWSRAALGVEFANQPRYFHIIAAMLAPALAIAADAIARRWTVLVPVVMVLLLLGVPGNVDITWNQTGKGRGERTDRDVYLAFAVVPAAADAPDWVRPDPNSAPSLTLGWLRQGIADGRVPRLKWLYPRVERDATFRLSLQQIGTLPRDLPGCSPLVEPAERRLEQGETIGFRHGSIRVSPVTSPDDRVPPPVLTFDAGRASRLLAVTGPLDVRITPDRRRGAPELCSVVAPP